MKAAVFYGKQDIRIEDWPKPEIAPDEVLLRVKACGVCGTDVHIYEGDQGAADCYPPCILGHEMAGEIEAVGKQVTGFKPGDRVCVDPNDTCGKCTPCKNGNAHYCEKMRGIGTVVNGGFAEYVAVPQKQAYRLADSVPFEAGAMGEPVSCCLHGIDLCEIRPGDAVAVIGGGMIGLLMLQLAKLCGASFTALLEPVAGKREMGARLGADLCIDPLHENVKELLHAHGIHRLNAVIECAGLPSTVKQAIDLAGYRSVVMLFGLTKPDEEVPVKPFELFRKEAVLKASFINPYTMERAVSLINSGRIDVVSMRAAVASLDALPKILSDPKVRSKGKFLIDPWKAPAPDEV